MKQEIKSKLKKIEALLFKDVFKYLKLEKLLMTILIVKNKSGFFLDIKSNGLTDAVKEIITSVEIDDKVVFPRIFEFDDNDYDNDINLNNYFL